MDQAKKFFEDIPDEELKAEPLVYSFFATGISDPKYMPVCDMTTTTVSVLILTLMAIDST